MRVLLLKLYDNDLAQFKKDMQNAFQNGFEGMYGKTEDIILPEKDIDASLNERGAIAYKAIVDGQMVGGAVVVIDEETQYNHLHLLYVKCGAQAKGIGYEIWQRIEELHPDTKVWETCTPYFERRNIHFYVNKCGFHIVKFEKEECLSKEFIGEGMLIFQKQMKKSEFDFLF